MEKTNTVFHTQKTMENFLKQMEKKVSENTYKTKEELLAEIHDFKTFIGRLPKTEELHLQNFEKEIEKILQAYDENTTQMQKDETTNYKEYQRQNGQVGATMEVDGQVHTIKQINGEEKSIWEEMNDIYNKTAVQSLDTSTTPPKDTIENNFELLRKYTHEEVYPQNRNGNLIKTFSVRTKALQYYSAKKNVAFTLLEDGMARDNSGNIYEAIIHITGEITIHKTKQTVFESGLPQTREKVELDKITMSELITFEKTKPQEKQTINFAFLEYLKMHLDDDSQAYRGILRSANLSKEETEMYEDLLKEELEQKKQNERMMQKRQESHVKILIPKNQKHGNGFVDALLLSIITSLFGGLCLAYFLIGILD